MTFKPGDLCEIVGSRFYPAHIGRECTVAGYSVKWPGELLIEIHGVTPPNGSDHFAALPEHLRLKRPPCWDRWITDTNEVRDEQLDQVPA